MDAIKRIRRSESMWREILSRRTTSGMTDADFCRAEGIHPTMLRRWRSRLDKGKNKKPIVRVAAKVATPFIDIGAVAESRSALEVRLELGGGLVLSIARG
jgi:transposase-like protein